MSAPHPIAPHNGRLVAMSQSPGGRILAAILSTLSARLSVA